MSGLDIPERAYVKFGQWLYGEPLDAEERASGDAALDSAAEVLRVTVAAELRAQAEMVRRWIARRGDRRSVQTGNKAFELVAHTLTQRADTLDPEGATS